jgi:hypothetical protein
MPRSILFLMLVVTLAGFIGVTVGSAESLAADEAAAVPAAAQIAEWIQQLKSDRFTERSEASKRLEAAGKQAFPALAEAATGENREVSLRAVEVLRKQLEQGDGATKEAARTTLQKIADSNHETAAQRAKEVLNPPPPEAPAAPGIQIVPGVPGLQIMPQIQIQVQAAGGGVTRQMRIQNGSKEVEATENGRKTKITENPNEGIKIEVTETKDGRETKRTYAAKTADELKRNHPEGYELYEKYAKQQAGLPQQVQIVAGQALAAGIQNALPLADKLSKASAITTLKHARQLVESAAKQLERGQPAADKDQDVAPVRKRLEEIAKEIEAERAKLEK